MRSSKILASRSHDPGAFLFVPGQGFEPQFSDSESDVLPLDDPGMMLVSMKSCNNASGVL